jgi:hypothetical protein
MPAPVKAATNPQGTYRRNHGRGHSYFVDDDGTGRGRVQGVTTILNDGLPKSGLYNWAGRECGGYAADHWDELATLPITERMERIAGAPNSTRDSAGVKGTRVHTIAERLVHGEKVVVPEDIRGHVEGCVDFLDAWNVQPMLTEFPVFSRRYRYAGSPDLAAWVYDEEDPVLIDWKTNRKGPYGESALQLAAYAGADFYLEPDGKGGWAERPLPKFSAHWVVWLRADGYSAYPMESGPEIFRAFLYVQQVARISKESRDWKGDELSPPVKEQA